MCPVYCIYDGEDQFLINPEDEVPEDRESYIAKNAGFDYDGMEPG